MGHLSGRKIDATLVIFLETRAEEKIDQMSVGRPKQVAHSGPVAHCDRNTLIYNSKTVGHLVATMPWSATRWPTRSGSRRTVREIDDAAFWSGSLRRG